MGATPLDVARIFGPYPAIEAKLGAALLNRQFDTHFAIRRGSLLRKQAEGAIESEDTEGDALSPDENRAAESTTLVEPIKKDENASLGGDVTVENQGAVGTRTLPSVAAGEKVQTIIDISTATDLSAALTMLSSGVEARFDEQAARSDEQAARFDEQTTILAVRFDEQTNLFSARFDEQATRSDEQAARSDAQTTRLDALQSENAAITAKLDVLLVAQQQR